MTVEDINNITFERVVRGYRTQDVDDFLAKIARDMDGLKLERDTALAERDAAIADKSAGHDASEKKLYILAEKIEQYRADEENLKIALLNAQRLGESVVQEARQKAEKIVKDANGAANKIYEELKLMQAAEEHRLMVMRSDVSKFRAEVLTLYKNHIELLNNVPSYEEQVAQAKQAKPVPQAQEPQAQAEPTEKDTAEAAQMAELAPQEDAPQEIENNIDNNAFENTAVEAENIGVFAQPEEKSQTQNNGQKSEKSTFEEYVGIRFDT